MVQSPSGAADWLAASQEITSTGKLNPVKKFVFNLQCKAMHEGIAKQSCRLRIPFKNVHFEVKGCDSVAEA